MRKKKIIVVWLVCCATYLALTPWRHPYFNAPIFGALVMAGMLFAILFESARLDKWKGVIYSAVIVHIASVVAYLVAWVAESASGFHRALAHFDIATTLGTTLLFPFFSYAVPVVLLVTACNRVLAYRTVQSKGTEGISPRT